MDYLNKYTAIPESEALVTSDPISGLDVKHDWYTWMRLPPAELMNQKEDKTIVKGEITIAPPINYGTLIGNTPHSLPLGIGTTIIPELTTGITHPSGEVFTYTGTDTIMLRVFISNTFSISAATNNVSLKHVLTVLRGGIATSVDIDQHIYKQPGNVETVYIEHLLTDISDCSIYFYVVLNSLSSFEFAQSANTFRVMQVA